MKKSVIKNLYNQSDAALNLLKVYTCSLPYSSDQVKARNILKAAALAAELWKPVKVMCDYMIDDGSTNMTERLLNIKAEVSIIEYGVAKMWKDDKDELTDELKKLALNCRDIINTIKDMEECTANGVEPQQKHIEAPQQPIGGNSGELAGSDNENAPESSKQPDIKKEELPTIYDDEINKVREQQVFYNAIKGGWMQLIGTTYKWLKNKEYLALMCGLLYWGDEVKDDLGANTDEWGEYPKTLSKSKHRFKYEYGGGIKTSKDIKDLFGGVDVSNLRSQLSELPDEYGSITRLFPTD